MRTLLPLGKRAGLGWREKGGGRENEVVVSSGSCIKGAMLLVGNGFVGLTLRLRLEGPLLVGVLRRRMRVVPR